jgi:hypothetical protein
LHAHYACYSWRAHQIHAAYICFREGKHPFACPNMYAIIGVSLRSFGQAASRDYIISAFLVQYGFALRLFRFCETHVQMMSSAKAVASSQLKCHMIHMNLDSCMVEHNLDSLCAFEKSSSNPAVWNIRVPL